MKDLKNISNEELTQLYRTKRDKAKEGTPFGEPFKVYNMEPILEEMAKRKLITPFEIPKS